MSPPPLPTINAFLNGIAGIFLVLGFIQIKKGNRAAHQKFMISALISSALFMIGYVIYHYTVGSVPYPYHDWTRPVYFIILIPHIILAAVMVPFILAAVYFAWRKNFDRHKRFTRRVWPVWMYVSVSGIVIYLMLYQF
jgi:putative membrane protein